MASIRESIEITYQNRPCAAGQMGRSLGLEPDRGWVTMLASASTFSLEVENRVFFPMSELSGIVSLHHCQIFKDLIKFITQTDEAIPTPTVEPNKIAMAGKLVFDSKSGSGESESPDPVTLEHVYIGRGGLVEEDQDTEGFKQDTNLVKIHLTDIRAFWDNPGGLMWGDYNVILPEGCFDPHTVDENGVPFTLRDLITNILAALPGGVALTSKSRDLIDTLPPPTNQIYRYTSAKTILAKLLEDNGLEFGLTSTGRAEIVKGFKNHTTFSFQKQGGGSLTIPQESTKVSFAVAHTQPPPAIIVIGGPNYRVVEQMMIAVYQDEDGVIRRLTDVPNLWGYSLEQAAAQVLKSDQFQFDDLQNPARRRIAKAWFWRGFQVQTIAGKNTQNDLHDPSTPIGPFLDPDSLVMTNPIVEGVTHRQVVAPNPNVIKINVDIALEGYEERIARMTTLLVSLQAYKDSIKGQAFAELKAEGETWGTADIQIADPEDYAALVRVIEQRIDIDESIAKINLMILEDTAAKEELEAKFGTLPSVYQIKRSVKVWQTDRFGVIPENEYSIDARNGIVRFNRPFGPLTPVTEGSFNFDQAKLLSQSLGPIITYGTPMDTGRPSDWFTITFTSKGTATAIGEILNVPAFPIFDPGIKIWIDKKGEQFDTAEAEAKAAERAATIFARPAVVNGAKYKAEGFWPVEVDSDIRSIVWSSRNGDDASTVIAANTDNTALEGFPTKIKRDTVAQFRRAIAQARESRSAPEGKFEYIAP